MTLLELSAEYARSEALLRARISRLRAMAKAEPEPGGRPPPAKPHRRPGPSAAGDARADGADGALL